MVTAIAASKLSKCYRINSPRELLANALANSRIHGAGDAPHGTGGNDTKILWALKDVSFAIEQGESVGFIGRNGAGKSTLLKLLSRITDPTSGTAKIYGRTVSLLEVGTGFHSELTGRENVYLSGSILGMKRREIKRKFDEIVAFSGVESQLDMPVKYYSSGQYVRLGFAVAAHLEQDILLIDEVLAVGDAAFRAKCQDKIHQLLGSGRTIVSVAHDATFLQEVCDRLIWLNAGSVIDSGEPAAILKKYLENPDGARASDATEFYRANGSQG